MEHKKGFSAETTSMHSDTRQSSQNKTSFIRLRLLEKVESIHSQLWEYLQVARYHQGHPSLDSPELATSLEKESNVLLTLLQAVRHAHTPPRSQDCRSKNKNSATIGYGSK